MFAGISTMSSETRAALGGISERPTSSSNDQHDERINWPKTSATNTTTATPTNTKQYSHTADTTASAPTRSQDSSDINNSSPVATTKMQENTKISTNNKVSRSPSAAGEGSSSGPNQRKSNTTTLSKFKEKRPEPLKLSSNLNQEIPLDLSVNR